MRFCLAQFTLSDVHHFQTFITPVAKATTDSELTHSLEGLREKVTEALDKIKASHHPSLDLNYLKRESPHPRPRLSVAVTVSLFRPSAAVSRDGIMESCTCCRGCCCGEPPPHHRTPHPHYWDPLPPPPPHSTPHHWLTPPPCLAWHGWLGRSAFTLTKRTC